MKKSVLSKLLAVACLLVCASLTLCSCGGHTHSFVEGKCECGESDPNYVPPHTHTFVEGKCQCGESDPNYIPNNNNNGGGDENVDPTYTVTVVDENGAPLANATVQFCVGDLCRLPVFTDANGVATLEVPSDNYTVKVSLSGYTGESSYSFAEGSVELTVTLTQIAD